MRLVLPTRPPVLSCSVPRRVGLRARWRRGRSCVRCWRVRRSRMLRPVRGGVLRRLCVLPLGRRRRGIGLWRLRIRSLLRHRRPYQLPHDDAAVPRAAEEPPCGMVARTAVSALTATPLRRLCTTSGG